MEFGETLLGFTVLGGPVLLVAYWLYLRGAHRRDVTRLAQHALDTGKPLDASLIETLGTSAAPSPDRDLRRGCIFVALALAVCVFATVVGEEVLYGLATFPGFVGIAYVLFWLRGRRGED